MKRILFSPIGSTDPISGEHDGALLHIIRAYRPEKLVLYLSKEICELEEKDGRYSYCLGEIQKYLGYDFDIDWQRRENLVDVHIFDFFLNEFKALLDEIYDEEAEILLNVSSGTPAMKSALQILASLYAKPLIPVQVSTPARSINEREDIKGDYLPELQWECNQDNCADFENRCTISEVLNLTNSIRVNMIKEHVDAYDYVAALRLAKPIAEYINSEAVNLIQAGAARLQLDKSECQKHASEYDIFPKKSGDEWRVFEYLMLLDVKLKKKEYADFVRALSPLFYEVLERIIKGNSFFAYSEYTTISDGRNGKTMIKWNAAKCSVSSIFNRSGVWVDRDRLVNTNDFARLITSLDFNSSIKELVGNIRDVEESIRNYAAHTIMDITEDRIKSFTGFSSKEIFDMMRRLIIASGIRISAEYLKTYDKLNEEIKKRLG